MDQEMVEAALKKIDLQLENRVNEEEKGMHLL
jgi:hypothetical protein